MIELLIAVCLVSDLSHCKNVSLTYAAEGVTPMQCMMMTMPQIAKWSQEHPNWVARRWTCRHARLRANI
jgi:hypothetical protein